MAVSDRDDELLDLAVELARAGGSLAREGRHRSGVRAGATKSSATDEVTDHDRAAECLIVERLRAVRPDDAVIGEEGAAVTGSSGHEWFLDPIDGTTNFVYDLPSWCTSVAVARDRVMVAGAVYLPVTDEMFAARLGGGATLDGHPIRCTDEHDLHRALVATGFGYDPAVRRTQATRVAAIIDSIRDVRRLGSAAIDLCHVAAGRVDAYYEEHLHSWDAAAGLLIATEAGAVASDFGGDAPRPEELIVAAPGLHTALLELVARPPHAV
ncbi:MAG: inositol monophosphatase family protein [Ilumatobacteraceae bacterium]